MTHRDVGSAGERASTRAHLEPLPQELLDTPLDYIFADHFRQRSLCGHLRRIAAERQVARTDAEALLRFVSVELPLHHDDETDDLFTALRRRALSEDEIEPILARLSAGHDQPAAWAPLLRSLLDTHRRRETVLINRTCADAMLAFAAREQRHLSVENGIVLVLARKRLTPADLAAMSVAMTARRLGAC